MNVPNSSSLAGFDSRPNTFDISSHNSFLLLVALYISFPFNNNNNHSSWLPIRSDKWLTSFSRRPMKRPTRFVSRCVYCHCVLLLVYQYIRRCRTMPIPVSTNFLREIDTVMESQSLGYKDTEIPIGDKSDVIVINARIVSMNASRRSARIRGAPWWYFCCLIRAIR